MTQRESIDKARPLVKDGKCDEAAEHIKRALAISQDAEALLLSAECHAKQGALVEALAELGPVTAEEAPPKDKARQRRTWDRAKALSEQLRARVARLAIHVGSPGVTARVLLNGAELDPKFVGIERPINPGSYEVRVEAPGQTPEPVRFEVSEGQARVVNLFLTPAPQAPPAPAPPPPLPPLPHVARPQAPAPPPAQAQQKGTPVVTYVSFGVGAAGLVVGATAGIIALTMAPELDCPDARCTDDQAEDLRKARALATVSNIGLSAGLVGCAIGVITLFSGKDSEPQRGAPARRRHLALRLGPGMAALEGHLP